MKNTFLFNPITTTHASDLVALFNHCLSKRKFKIPPCSAFIKNILIFSALLSHLFFLPTASATQAPDFTYTPNIQNAENISGPIILFDDGHNNAHKANQSYYGFTKLLTADGYNIRAIKGQLVADPTRDHKAVNQAIPLSDFQQQQKLANILVIASPCLSTTCIDIDDNANALNDLEVAEVRQWVEQGGSLFLIFDHLPFAQVTNLVSAFGIDLVPTNKDHYIFTTPDNDSVAIIDDTQVIINGARFLYGTLNENSDLVRGRIPAESIDYTHAFVGYGFQVSQTPSPDTTYEPLMTFSGISQGMALNVGSGKVYISSEAAMFSAQLDPDHDPVMGFQSPNAEFNAQYLRNIIHWLDGRMSIISGRVSLADGTGISDVTIEFSNQNGSSWNTVTDTNGYYISPRGMQIDSYLVSAISSAYDFLNNDYPTITGESPVRNKNFTATPK